ncbi:MAG: NAD(P)-dependent glycerol-3-phosphate dehydrogenase [Oligoflexia bacterium]|nr:NAD(P)-dependent glycerol-3-phosphate dehydrogenase [Oligoflexia bacterium]MBF0364005.1 NAD(P)-dependent glycerol-3-phosphate dehydrogenase [Oligoflexia bacterium]
MNTKQYNTAVVLAAGTFGSSMASVLSNNFKQVIVKVRSPELYQTLQKGANPLYLPGIKLPQNITPAISWEEVSDLTQSNAHVELIVNGLPSHALSLFAEKYHYHHILSYLERGIPIVSLTKGINQHNLKLPDDILFDLFRNYEDLFTFLSGPSYAEEIIEEQITLVSLAGKSRNTIINVANMLNTNYFRAFPTYDIKGVLLGGALKNVLAIAAGILEGLGYNHNTRAALITAGISDMLRFGQVLNARPETFYGLSGMGDLILTTTGTLSRNKWFGKELAKGRSPEEILSSQRTVVEGHQTSKAAEKLAQKYNIKCRIFNGVYRILYENKNPHSVIEELLSYSAKVHTLF